MQTLLQLRSGDTAVLDHLEGPRAFRRHLMELGLLPGTPIRMVRRVLVGGMVEIEARAAHVSLRLGETRGVFVRTMVGGPPA